MNPYQGCEHGCAYCYARPTHEYWGYSAGIDFEQTVLVKKNAPTLLKQTFSDKNWKPSPIILSGNTDCYQPAERKFKLTRELLKICLLFKHPVSIITKNHLIIRDLDILKQMNEKRLVEVNISITTLDETLRRNLEPRTSSIANKIKTIQVLAENNIPVNVMIAPIIPGLNEHEIPQIMKTASEAGAHQAYYTIIRLNETVEPFFLQWLRSNYPNKFEKVSNHIKATYSGKYAGNHIYSTNPHTVALKKLISINQQKYFPERERFSLNCSDFTPTPFQQKLF